MRVNIALPGLEGLSGGMRVAAQYTRHLHQAGHQVTLVVRRPGLTGGRLGGFRRLIGADPQLPQLPEERGHFDGLDVSIVHLDEKRKIRPAEIPDADLTVSTWWTTAEWASDLPPAKGRHVHFIQDYEIFNPADRARIEAIYSRDSARIVVANWLQQKLLQRHGVGSTVVTNGVNTRHFSAPPRDPHAPPRVGFMYNGHPRKNCALAIAALHDMHARDPQIGAMAFGATDRPTKLPDWVTYEAYPEQARIAQIYAACDLWLFTSKSEGFGLPLLEAMACRTPVLATRAGAAPDLVDGQNGWLAPSDPQGYADRILAFLDRPTNKWRVASEAARRTAETHNLGHAARAFEAALAGFAAEEQP